MRENVIRSAAVFAAAGALLIGASSVSDAATTDARTTGVPADFDGDGFADLAIGVPYEDEVTTNDGVVNIIYGSIGGLNQAGNQVWSQDSPGIGGAGEAGDFFGSAVAAGDFDGDGYSDLAVGAPNEDQAANSDGAVTVIYGSPSGLNQAGNQVWTQDSAGIGGSSEFGDSFGTTLATGDFDADGYADLAVGVPSEDQVVTNDGVVNVIYGSASGLNQAGNQVWSQDSAGIGGGNSVNDAFGSSLAVGNFGNGVADDLAIGVPTEDQAAADDGAVNVIYGSRAGLNQAGNQVWSQDSAGIGDTSEASDYFGFALAAGDFNANGYADLAIGVPDEDQAPRNSGAVNVIYGGSTGLNQAGNQVWSQDSAGIGGGSEPNDLFGLSLAAGDMNGDGRGDLAIGVPREDQAAIDDGAVNVIYGSASGLNQSGNQVWSQGSAGIGDTPEEYDRFGADLTVANFGYSGGHADLAIGVDSEDHVGTNDGAVNVIYGWTSGLDEDGNDLWSQDSPGIAGVSETGDAFGLSVAAS